MGASAERLALEEPERIEESVLSGGGDRTAAAKEVELEDDIKETDEEEDCGGEDTSSEFLSFLPDSEAATSCSDLGKELAASSSEGVDSLRI